MDYSNNSSVEQEAELYKHVKDYNNVVLPETGTAVKGFSKKATPKQHAMQNAQPFTKEAPKHTMQNTDPSANQDKSEVPKHTMRNN